MTREEEGGRAESYLLKTSKAGRGHSAQLLCKEERDNDHTLCLSQQSQHLSSPCHAPHVSHAQTCGHEVGMTIDCSFDSAIELPLNAISVSSLHTPSCAICFFHMCAIDRLVNLPATIPYLSLLVRIHTFFATLFVIFIRPQSDGTTLRTFGQA